MKSTSGSYFIGLDHVRAVAAFLVFTWHFIRIADGQHAPPPTFPLSLLTEGHTGVALFMALSGYLFAKLLDGKRIIFSHFIWNRFLRLAPLLFIVISIIGLRIYFLGHDMSAYVDKILAGAIIPSLPNGGWSITVEFHFYLMLPALLFLTRKWEYSLLVVLIGFVALRLLLYQEFGQIQTLAYWTIIGRADQFIIGILAFQFRKCITGKNILASLVLMAYATYIWYFDSLGGFFDNPSYPSPSLLWVFAPTIEGLAYGTLISWYDNSFRHSTGKISRFVALIGTYSYSIYLLHFFFVSRMASIIDHHIIELSNIHLAILFSLPCFLLMVPIGYISFRFIESPFLRYRTKYTSNENAPGPAGKTIS